MSPRVRAGRAAVSALLLGWAVTCAAQGGTSSPACRFLPPGGKLIPFEPAGSDSSYPITTCGSNYGSAALEANIVVNIWRDAARAERWLQNRMVIFNPPARESSGYGERTLQLTPAPGTTRWTQAIFFRRGCYAVEGFWDAASEATIRRHLAEVDRAIAAGPACPGAAAVPPKTPATGSMSLGLACDPARLQDAGRVACNAAVSNLPAGADIVYRWTVDGALRGGATGRDLLVEGLAVGAHVVTVAARDTRSGTELGPQSASFTRRAPGGPGGATPIGGSGTDLVPIVAGTAIAIAIALAGLAVRRRKPRAASPSADKAPRVQYLPPTPASEPLSVPAVAVPAARPLPGAGPEDVPQQAPRPKTVRKPAVAKKPRPRPSGGPEEGGQPDRQRSLPTLSVRMIVQPSILTARLYNLQTPQIVGDGVDYCFAGFDVTVGPPGEWQLDDAPDPGSAVEPTWAATHGRVTAVDRYPGFQISGRDLAERSPAHNVVVEAGPWHDQDGEILLALTVRARARSRDGATAELGPVTVEQRIPILGAKPRSELWIGKVGTAADDSEAISGGTIVADANGAERVYVDPAVHLFDLPYAGGLDLRLKEVPALPRTANHPMLNLVDLFDLEWRVPRVAVDGTDYVDQGRAQQRLVLRCKFRLDDPLGERGARDGCPVPLQIRLFGNAFGLENPTDQFDPMLVDHYAACGKRYAAGGLPEPAPVAVQLRPSEIAFEKLVDLPRADRVMDAATQPESSGDEFVARLRPRLRSASGDPVTYDTLQADRPTIEGWTMIMAYEPPTEEPLRRWDAMATKSGDLYAEVHGVDKEGYLLFDGSGGGSPVPYYEYDHWKSFYNADAHYLVGQCCKMRATVRADGKAFHGEFFVGPPCKLYVYIDFRDDAGPVGHPFLGLIDEQGRELRAGFYPYLTFDAVAPWESAAAAEMTVGGLVGAKAASWIVGEAALALAALIPGVGQAGMAIRVVRWAAVGAGAFGGAAAGFAAGLTGIGRIYDEGNFRPKEPGSSDLADPHRFDVCRGSDISRAEYARVLARLKEWKRRSDTDGLIYNLSGKLVKDFGPFTGNCVSFVVDNFATIGATIPYPADANLERPGDYGRAVASDPRCESNPKPEDGRAFQHPWIYGKAIRWKALDRDPTANLRLDDILGVTQPPRPSEQPPADASRAIPYRIVDGGPQ